jgi:hypothetical protein
MIGKRIPNIPTNIIVRITSIQKVGILSKPLPNLIQFTEFLEIKLKQR